MIYYHIENEGGKVIASNIEHFPGKSVVEKNKNSSKHTKGKGYKSVEEIKDEYKTWLVVVDEPDLLKSSKLFARTLRLYQRIAKDIFTSEKSILMAHRHTIRNIQTQIRQKLDLFADEDKFIGNTFADSVATISSIVRNDIESAADLVCYVQKRIADLRAHLLGIEVIHLGAQFQLNPSTVSLRRAILSQYTPFIKGLEEKSVNLNFHPSLSEDVQVSVDKNMFSLVMYNFFSNAIKYTMPNSEIRLKFDEGRHQLDISMISLKIEWDELSEICKDRVRGKHSSGISGDGIGLYALQRALEFMGKGHMIIMPNYDKVQYPDEDRGNGKPYTENHFQFIF